MVIADDHFVHAGTVNDIGAIEIPRTDPRERIRELENEKNIDAQHPDQLDPFPDRRKEFNGPPRPPHNLLGMGIERDNDTPSFAHLRPADHLPDDLRVCQVHTVKRPHSDHGAGVTPRLFHGMGDDHDGVDMSIVLYAASSSIVTASASRYGPILVRSSADR